MSEEKTETISESHEEHHKLPLLQTFVALAVITLTEVLIAELDHTPLLVTILLLLTFSKMVTIAAVFMEVAYDKDTLRIVLYVFVVPFVGVVLLLLAITQDWRAPIIA